jgi:glutathione synthase/RimK-type ligase-like ATP-grasp enzyme
VRSIVRLLEDNDMERLERITACPTQFQAFIPGQNVRVHVVGRQVFATRINSTATDYRYAKQQVGESAILEAYGLSSDIAERCIRLAHQLKLTLAGIDLKITPSGKVYCFEVNPCPAYSYYQLNAGQPIARSIAEHLAA